MKLKNKTPRYYQSDSAEEALKSILVPTNHPICAIPTGAGKTIIIALIIVEYLKRNPDKNILVVSHVKEILQQNYDTLVSELDENIGLYSAGLGRKDTDRVTVVGIQSGRNNVKAFKDVGLIIIDECHLVSEWDQGTYRKFLSCFDCNYIGLTATPFRASGYIHLSKEALFTEICHDLTSYENFNKLVEEGYLTKLYSKGTDLKMKIPKGVGTVAGDYVNNDLDILFNNESITESAVKEISSLLKKGYYKKVLIFCINIEHAESVSQCLNDYDISTDFVHSKMDDDRVEILSQFKSGILTCLTNVNVLTTGLDVPDIDMIVLLRPTKSLSLYCQMVGRGLRIAEGKDHCLVLDFAENVSRLGPVNDLNIDQKGKPEPGGEPPTKECPIKKCKCLNHIKAEYCIACGYKFIFKPKITRAASELSVVKVKEPQVLTVSGVSYNRHVKKDKPDSVRIDFQVGLRKYSKWLAVESLSLYAADKAKYEVPRMLKEGEELHGKFTVDNILRNQHKFKRPLKIVVDVNEKFPRIEEIIYDI